jgi:hypothetical protein
MPRRIKITKRSSPLLLIAMFVICALAFCNPFLLLTNNRAGPTATHYSAGSTANKPYSTWTERPTYVTQTPTITRSPTVTRTRTPKATITVRPPTATRIVITPVISVPTQRPTVAPTRRPAATATIPVSRYRTGATCKDGTSSSATGKGACSRHGGVSCWRYSDGTCTSP